MAPLSSFFFSSFDKSSLSLTPFQGKIFEYNIDAKTIQITDLRQTVGTIVPVDPQRVVVAMNRVPREKKRKKNKIILNAHKFAHSRKKRPWFPF